jgi:predicted glycoside hydrolase/deacetylase ChbG (UPF0249 family)
VDKESDLPAFVVNADDLGLTESANIGIFRAHEQGIVSSASLVMTTSASQQAISGLTNYPTLGVGLHFSLSAGKPVSDRNNVPDLVSAQGYFRWRFMTLFAALFGPSRKKILAQIAHELDAQIQLANSFGIQFDHINGERHIHLLPGVFELVADAAIRYGIPHIRLIKDVGFQFLQPRGILATILNGGIAKVFLLSVLSGRARKVASANNLKSIRYATLLFTGNMHLILPAIWSAPPKGITEIAVHPGAPDESHDSNLGNSALARYLLSPDRRHEMDVCLTLRKVKSPARLKTFRESYEKA